MATYLIPNVWVDAPCVRDPEPVRPEPPAAPAQPPAVSIDTVEDYLAAHGLEVLFVNPGLRELPIGAVTVEHDSSAQLTYFVQDGTVVGSASWPVPADGPEAYAGRGQQPAQSERAV